MRFMIITLLLIVNYEQDIINNINYNEQDNINKQDNKNIKIKKDTFRINFYNIIKEKLSLIIFDNKQNKNLNIINENNEQNNNEIEKLKVKINKVKDLVLFEILENQIIDDIRNLIKDKNKNIILILFNINSSKDLSKILDLKTLDSMGEIFIIINNKDEEKLKSDLNKNFKKKINTNERKKKFDLENNIKIIKD